ncbi:Cornichon family protein [Perilla frutescens var. hirtella]|nr:Cornichon family protein [Perilla frutescens var. frutescens]KAH6801287.1 Cornichon family protein [Perilla frutescens var. hirtella]
MLDALSCTTDFGVNEDSKDRVSISIVSDSFLSPKEIPSLRIQAPRCSAHLALSIIVSLFIPSNHCIKFKGYNKIGKKLMCLADLEFDYINPYDSASRINRVVLPEFITQGVLCFLFLVTGHWFMSLLCVPYLYYNVRL